MAELMGMVFSRISTIFTGDLRELKGPALDRLHAPNVLTAHLALVLRTMALDSRGLAWLPQLLVGDDIAGGRLVVAAPDEWSIDLEIRQYSDRAALGKAAEAFWLAAQARGASAGATRSHAGLALRFDGEDLQQ